MRRNRPLAAAAAAVALALLGACSSGAAAPASSGATTLGTEADRTVLDGITVTGEGQAVTPTIELATKPVSVTATARKVLKPGSGDASTEQSIVTTHLALFLGSDAKLLDTTYQDASPQSIPISEEGLLPGLRTGLTGVQAGSRVLFIVPPAEAFGSQGRPELGISGTDNLIVVGDVVSVTTPLKQAEGTAVPPVAGLPTVTFDAAKGPAITIPPGATPPTDTTVAVLVEGTGPAVTAGQTVVVHYTGALWKDGSVFDSSWTRGAPFSFTIGRSQVIKAWDSALVDKKVGSRVLIVVPPKDGYGADGSPPAISGTDTLVFVVDILAAV